MRSKNKYSRCRKYWHLVLAVLIISFHGKAQIANYVNNPSFEISLPSATFSPYDAVAFWGPLDTNKGASYLVTALSTQGNNAPNCVFGFQHPRTGNNFILAQFYCRDCSLTSQRGYPRNRLKQTLKPNVKYCGKYHVVNTNNNRVAISDYGMYFGGAILDTISQCMSPITYLVPQIENQSGIIIDTLNWTPITGTFVANGTEKYLLLGNFKSNGNTNTLSINPPIWPMSADIYMDDVSLVEMDLPAFAGRDTFFLPGSSVFIGREPEVGINDACMWYKLPDMTTAIDTVAGLWVTPVGTTTYVVRQQLWCSGVKWDTVVVHESAVGIKEIRAKSQDITLYPVPAGEELKLEFKAEGGGNYFTRYSIVNSLGQLIREEDLVLRDKKANIELNDLPEGVYLLRLKSNNVEGINKRFVVER